LIFKTSKREEVSLKRIIRKVQEGMIKPKRVEMQFQESLKNVN